MSLPAPDLDDRRFQQLVDEAKRMVQQRCPEWTDHNVSDPGVTLIETFAYMTDTLLYRLNQVPDRHYVKFLELIGVRLFPATAAKAPVTFWLTAPQPVVVDIPAGAVAATTRTEVDEAIVFTTAKALPVVPCSRLAVGFQLADGALTDATDTMTFGTGFHCFSSPPMPGDALLVGLSDPVPSCAVRLTMDCRIEGVGVDPDDPPLTWEAWGGVGWLACEVDSDTTGGLNRAGDVVLHVPEGHVASVLAERRAGWLRARVTLPEQNQAFYSSPPKVTAVSAATIGGTTEAVNAETVSGEVIGLSEGVAGQRFPLQRRPVTVSAGRCELEVAGGSGWQRWREVEHFADTGPDDLVFTIDRVAGEIVFGPVVREPDGSLRQYGAVPPKGVPIRCVGYQVGGGRSGNVAAGTIRVLKTTIPFVGTVQNRDAAAGGVDAESVDAAKIRGPLLLRSRDRAVTPADYEQLAREAAPEIARVRCGPAGDETPAGTVRVLVVPAAAMAPDGTMPFESLLPSPDSLAKIADYLEDRRCVGARVLVEPPTYQGVTIVAQLRAKPRASEERLRRDAMTVLNRRFNALVGGPDGAGWPFGRSIHVGEVYAALQHLPGCEMVVDARLYGADPLTGRRGERTDELQIGANTLVYSFGHQIRVQGS